MRDFELKGNTADEKLKSAERMFKHLRGRMHKTVVGITPPTLVSNFIQKPAEDGLVMTAAFPGGKITKGLVVVKEMPKEGVEYTLKTIKAKGGLLSRSLETKRRVQVIDLDMELFMGDVIEFYASEGAAGIWVSFLWEAEMEDRKIQQFLREELENEGV